MYEIALCQRFDKNIHGFDSYTSSPDLREHYLCIYTFDIFERDQYDAAKCLGYYYRATIEIILPHILYPGNEMVAIYKTFWLRIFQRLCRKWVLNRKYARSSRLFYDLIRREYTSC